MAKASGKAAGRGGAGSATRNFEERIERLETLGEQIRRADIPLDEALRAFEEGIALARTLEKDLEKVESRIEILMSGADAKPEDEPAELGLFSEDA